MTWMEIYEMNVISYVSIQRLKVEGLMLKNNWSKERNIFLHYQHRVGYANVREWSEFFSKRNLKIETHSGAVVVSSRRTLLIMDS